MATLSPVPHRNSYRQFGSSGVGGTVSATAVAGVATFNNLTFTAAGNYTSNATSAGLTSANSNSFTISPGSGNKLVFATQPVANAVAGQPLNPPVVVQVKDANGNVVTGSTAAVTISSVGDASSSSASIAGTAVGGTLTVNAVSGIATFSNLVFTATGTFTLQATSTGLANASTRLSQSGRDLQTKWHSQVNRPAARQRAP